MIYQLLTGRLPWEGTTLAELAIRRESERPLPPGSYDPAVPETLSTRGAALAGERPGAALLDRARARRRAARRARRREPPEADAEAPTRALAGGTTEATRRLAPSEPVAPVARPAPALPGRRGAPARWSSPPRPGRAARSPAASAARIGILLVIALLAAVIAAVVLLTTNAGQNTDLVKQTSPTRFSRSRTSSTPTRQ